MTNDMEFFFPELIPSENGAAPVPPEEMRFTELRAEPVLDGGPLRTRIYVEVTAFQKRPYIEVILNGSDGNEITSASIIEPISRKNVFTLHFRGGQQSGKFSLSARLYYPEQSDSDTREFAFEI
jgi:hypothetical protein